ncbi:MAG TPA: DUF2844 domain-containing protein [Burkholderiales bacterium]|nr:DUF2844 domain-containing protein [Burkholderiales bacterium]
MERRGREDRREGPVALLLVALALIPALAPTFSYGALGRMAASTDVDQKVLHARKSVRPGIDFTIHELTLPSGTAVREYVSADGRVFAVAWRGPTLPDLKQIFGDNNLQAFLSAPAEHHVPRKSRTVRQPGLVVHSAGAGRFFTGFAYIPSLKPGSVREEDIR